MSVCVCVCFRGVVDVKPNAFAHTHKNTVRVKTLNMYINCTNIHNYPLRVVVDPVQCGLLIKRHGYVYVVGLCTVCMYIYTEYVVHTGTRS